MAIWALRATTFSTNRMRCKIANLIAEIPAAGGLAPRCEAYLFNGETNPDIVISEEKYRCDRYEGCSDEIIAYMESAYQFYKELVNFDGFYIHASAVVKDGKAYLFSGNPGAGKSTHTRNWQAVFGDGAVVINDDKPALRRIDGTWYAYGTPWCGKDGINQNQMAPVAGLCFLVKADHNEIRRVDTFEALQKILGQTIYKFQNPDVLNKMLGLLDLFLKEISIYEMENLPNADAVSLSFSTMSCEAQEDI